LSKVILKGYITVLYEDLSAVREELPNHIKLTLQEEGCLVFEVKDIKHAFKAGIMARKGVDY